MDHISTRRLRRLAGGLIACVALVTGCSSGGAKSPGVASVGSPSGTSSSSGSTKASALAYSQCMRAHGIKDFPDPDANGDVRLEAHPGSDLGPDNPQFKVADAACKSLLPNKGVPPKNLKAENLKYAKCMRARGVSDFPDPKPDGTLQLQAEPGSDLDPNNPVFKKADDACKQYLPNGSKGGSLNTGGAGS